MSNQHYTPLLENLKLWITSVATFCFGLRSTTVPLCFPSRPRLPRVFCLILLHLSIDGSVPHLSKDGGRPHPQMEVWELNFPTFGYPPSSPYFLKVCTRFPLAPNELQFCNPYYRSNPQNSSLGLICPLSVEKFDRAPVFAAHLESESSLIQLKACETKHLGSVQSFTPPHSLVLNSCPTSPTLLVIGRWLLVIIFSFVLGFMMLLFCGLAWLFIWGLWRFVHGPK